VAKELIEKHDEDYILANIRVVEEELQEWKVIRNIPAYLMKAFQVDFRPLETEHSKLQAKKIQEVNNNSKLKLKGTIQLAVKYLVRMVNAQKSNFLHGENWGFSSFFLLLIWPKEELCTRWWKLLIVW
jgi:hypothetical protein